MRAEPADVVIYGATPGGIAAAIAAAKGGHTVLLAEPTIRLGGMTTNGLQHPDFRAFEAITGTYYDLAQRTLVARKLDAPPGSYTKRLFDDHELLRAKLGRILGATVALFTVMKGLPLTYSKDMQEDKEQVFDAADTLMLALAAMTGMVGDMTANRDSLAAAAASGFSTATDLADWLVRELGLPFREAHHVTGTLVARAEALGVDLPALTLAQMQAVHPGITDSVFTVLGVDNSVASRTSYGGTAPSQVRTQVARWKEVLA